MTKKCYELLAFMICFLEIRTSWDFLGLQSTRASLSHPEGPQDPLPPVDSWNNANHSMEIGINRNYQEFIITLL